MKAQFVRVWGRPRRWVVGIIVSAGALLVSIMPRSLHLLKAPPVVRAEEIREDVRATPPPSVTVGEFLQSYFGDRWPSIRTRLRPGTLDENSLIERDAIRPWSEVRQQIPLEDIIGPSDWQACIKRALAWEDGVNYEPGTLPATLYQGSGKEMTASDRAALLILVGEFDKQLQALGELAGEALNELISDRWSRDGYEATPIIPVDPVNPENRRALWFRYLSVEHWNIVVSVFEGESSDYDKALADIRALKIERYRAAHDFLEAHSGGK